jgi:AraC-like DNA-binding protein
MMNLEDFISQLGTTDHLKNKFYAVLLLNEGKGSFAIDNNIFQLASNMVFFINYNQVYHFQDVELCKGSVLLFTKSFYNHIYTGNKIIKSDTALAKMSPFIRLKAESRKDQWQSFEEIKREYQSTKSLFREIICLLLKAFVLKYIRYSDTNTQLNIQSDRKKILVNNFTNLVNLHFKELKTTSHYAKKLNLTANYLNSIVKENLDIPAGKFIKNRVILEAERLLLHTSLSVTEISYELGFSDKSHFGKYFKTEKKYSPNQYRIIKSQNSD